MAEFNLKLNINGVETASKNVKDLEENLALSKQGFDKLIIGSKEFTAAAANIQKLEYSIKLSLVLFFRIFFRIAFV